MATNQFIQRDDLAPTDFTFSAGATGSGQVAISAASPNIGTAALAAIKALPNAGQPGYVLTTNGAGVLSWQVDATGGTAATVPAAGVVAGTLVSGVVPTNTASGDLAGSYPSPTVKPSAVTGIIAALPLGAQAQSGVTEVIGADGQRHVLPATSAGPATAVPAAGVVAGTLVSGVVPTNAASGDLAGSYPSPTVKPSAVTGIIAALPLGAQAQSGVTEVIGADGQRHVLPAVSAAATVTVADEGNTITSGLTAINFTGDNIVATAGAGGVVTVTSIPTTLTNTTPSTSTTTAATPAFVNAAIAAIPSGTSALQPLMFTVPYTYIYDPGNGNNVTLTGFGYTFIGNTVTQARYYHNSGNNNYIWSIVPPGDYTNSPAYTANGVAVSARSTIPSIANFIPSNYLMEFTLSSGEIVILP